MISRLARFSIAQARKRASAKARPTLDLWDAFKRFEQRYAARYGTRSVPTSSVLAVDRSWSTPNTTRTVHPTLATAHLPVTGDAV